MVSNQRPGPPPPTGHRPSPLARPGLRFTMPQGSIQPPLQNSRHKADAVSGKVIL